MHHFCMQRNKPANTTAVVFKMAEIVQQNYDQIPALTYSGFTPGETTVMSLEFTPT